MSHHPQGTPPVAGADGQLASANGVAPSGVAQSKGEFAWKVHAYTNEYIRFADGKAGASVAWASALLAGLYAVRAHHHFLAWPTVSNIAWERTAIAGLSLAAFLFLGLATIAGLLTLWPRMWTGTEDEDTGWIGAMWNRLSSLFKKKSPPPPGLIFWESVRTFENDVVYAAAVRSASSGDLDEAVAKHVFHLARVSKAKYFWVTRSVWMVSVGRLYT